MNRYFCPCCKSKQYFILFTKKYQSSSFQYLKCRNCHQIYANILGEEISFHFHQRKKNLEIKVTSQFIGNQNKVKLIKKYKEKGNLLDIGCGEGTFLYNARENGFKVKGIEPAREEAEYGQQKWGLEIVSCPFHQANLPAKSFDIITLWQVVEHLANPLLCLEKIFTLLRDKGILLVSTPDFNSCPARFLKKHWWDVRPDHLNYFTPFTLKNMLKKAGFNQIHFVSYRDSLSLMFLFDSILSHFKKFKISAFFQTFFPFLNKVRISIPSTFCHTTAIAFK